MAGDLARLIRRQEDIERGAQAIPDPVERLRYLRGATAGAERKPLSRRWFAAAGLAFAVLPLRSDTRHRAPAIRGRTPQPARTTAEGIPHVWPVDHTEEYDLFSNGLRVENGLEVSHEPRSYHLMFRDSDEIGPRRNHPAGIVFHTTESDLAPFESEQKRKLKRIGREVLLYVRNKRAYHFVIDRFGRVHRIVAESDTANHAGRSVWADQKWIYLDLNASFLGVAFEAQTQGGEEPITAAQMRAARAVTEMLRARYNVAVENCVTHAQVSVNPANMKIGWHTDWGDRFPYKEVGLPNNYEIPNPSLYYFGFEYDPVYVKSTNADLWKGLVHAEQRVRVAAAERGVTLAEYRSMLRKKYKLAEASLRQRNSEDNEDEQN